MTTIHQSGEKKDMEIIRNLYGNKNGHFVLFDCPVGLIPPSTLDCYNGDNMQELIFIGPTYDFFTLLNRKYSHTEIASMIGIPSNNRTIIARYIYAQSEPRLKPEQWKELVIRFFKHSKDSKGEKKG